MATSEQKQVAIFYIEEGIVIRGENDFDGRTNKEEVRDSRIILFRQEFVTAPVDIQDLLLE